MIALIELHEINENDKEVIMNTVFVADFYYMDESEFTPVFIRTYTVIESLHDYAFSAKRIGEEFIRDKGHPLIQRIKGLPRMAILTVDESLVPSSVFRCSCGHFIRWNLGKHRVKPFDNSNETKTIWWILLSHDISLCNLNVEWRPRALFPEDHVAF